MIEKREMVCKYLNASWMRCKKGPNRFKIQFAGVRNGLQMFECPEDEVEEGQNELSITVCGIENVEWFVNAPLHLK